MTMSAAILCLAVCISNVIKKAGMCGKNIQGIIIQPIFSSSPGKNEQTRVCPEVTFQAKTGYFFNKHINRTTK